MPKDICSRIALAALAVALTACGGGGDGGGGPVTPPQPAPSGLDVQAAGPPPRFVPASAELAVGGTVEWTNTSPGTHDIVATSANWQQGQLGRTIQPGESFQTTIAAPGTYNYRCTLHEGMNGSIVVR